MKLLFIVLSFTWVLSPVSAQMVGTKVLVPSITAKLYRGTIKDIQNNRYKVSYDGFNYEAWLTRNQFTVADGAPADPPSTPPSISQARPDPVSSSSSMPGKVTVDNDNTLSADRPLISCPVQQPAVQNGAKPNPELFKKLVQCLKGEHPARKGLDGAVTVDVTNLKIGTPHKWDMIQDRGNATPSTIVYPVQVTYTLKQFYRTRTDVWENWVVIMNFYVDAFGEWAIGANQLVRNADHKDIPR